MRLTPRAEALLGQLPEALENLQRVLTGDKPLNPATSSRTFTLASLDYFDFAVLPTLLAHLRRRAPSVRLHVERASSESISRLAAGEIDVMLVGSSAGIPTQGLHRRELYRNPFRVIARADHPAIRRRLSLETYLQLEHVLVSVDAGGEGAVDRVLRAQSQTRRVALRVPHFASAPLAVATSDLVCTIASTMAQRGRELYGLRVYAPPVAVDPARIVMYWPAAHDADPRSPLVPWLPPGRRFGTAGDPQADEPTRCGEKLTPVRERISAAALSLRGMSEETLAATESAAAAQAGRSPRGGAVARGRARPLRRALADRLRRDGGRLRRLRPSSTARWRSSACAATRRAHAGGDGGLRR